MVSHLPPGRGSGIEAPRVHRRELFGIQHLIILLGAVLVVLQDMLFHVPQVAPGRRVQVVRLVEAAGGEAEIWCVTSSSLQGIMDLRKTGVRRQNQQRRLAFLLEFLGDGDDVHRLHIGVDRVDLGVAGL